MDKQTLSFQAEVKQILHLVTHSLYSNKEIFLRELVSNASDACDKLRFEALDKPTLFEDQPNLEVRVAFDAEAKTITISDNGIGMSADELENNAFVRVWRGLDPEGSEPCTAMGERATLVLLGDDYDGGHKAWVRWPDGSDDIVPGSQVQRG